MVEILRIVPWVFLAAGIAVVILGFKLAAGQARAKSWPSIEGRVVGHQVRPATEIGDPDLLACEIEYRLPGGGPQRMIDNVATNRPTAIGQTVELRFDPLDTGTVVRWRPISTGCFNAALIGMGVICIVGGAFGGWLSLGL